jgi:hypothetical protein
MFWAIRVSKIFVHPLLLIIIADSLEYNVIPQSRDSFKIVSRRYLAKPPTCVKPSLPATFTCDE